MKILVVIPARYGSTRFGGKVLARDTGKFLVQHTYEQALRAKNVNDVIIATDSDEVMAACQSFGARGVMTSADHQCGTDRIAEAVQNLDVDIVVNVQADEPEIDPENIDTVASLLIDNPNAHMATLVAGFENADDIADPNVVKAILDKNGKAIYFSRSVIPYNRDAAGVGPKDGYLRHLGIYAYRKDFILEITKLPQTSLELAEKLEQLRAIENGYTIMAKKVTHTCAGIDTAQQYEQFVKRYNNKQDRT